MRYHELGIETRREAPARARTQGEAWLIRAGYMSSDRQLTSLGQLCIARLESGSTSLFDLFKQTGLPALQLEGGKTVFPSPSGDVNILLCPACGYAEEADLAKALKAALPAEAALPLRRVATPECDTIEALAAFLGIPKKQTAKAMMYGRPSDGQFVFVVVRGDMQVSERKISALVGPVEPASANQMVKAGAAAGYASPIGLREALVIADELIPASMNLAVGANEPGFHLLNVNYGRDFSAQIVGDVTLAHADDPCPHCGAKLSAVRTNLIVDKGGIRPIAILAAFAEAFHDEKGLQLPQGVAPFDVFLVQLSSKQVDTRGPADTLYRDLESAGLAVLYDDRDERAGVKFNDADLIGCPLRLTVGEKNLREGMLESKRRDQKEIHTIKLSDARNGVLALLGDPDA